MKVIKYVINAQAPKRRMRLKNGYETTSKRYKVWLDVAKAELSKQGLPSMPVFRVFKLVVDGRLHNAEGNMTTASAIEVVTDALAHAGVIRDNRCYTIRSASSRMSFKKNDGVLNITLYVNELDLNNRYTTFDTMPIYKDLGTEGYIPPRPEILKGIVDAQLKQRD